MKEYVVLSGNTLASLEELVEKYLKSKWFISGGLTAVRGGLGDNMYYQAMVK